MIKYQIKPRFRLVRVETLKAGDRFKPTEFNGAQLEGLLYVERQPSQPTQELVSCVQARYPDQHIRAEEFVCITVRYNGQLKTITSMWFRGTQVWLKIR